MIKMRQHNYDRARYHDQGDFTLIISYDPSHPNSTAPNFDKAKTIHTNRQHYYCFYMENININNDCTAEYNYRSPFQLRKFCSLAGFPNVLFSFF